MEVLVGGTAEEIVAHVEKTWRRGKQMVAEIRAELGDVAGEVAPISKGGVEFLKAESPMHDTRYVQLCK